jgi:hypothetical protein
MFFFTCNKTIKYKKFELMIEKMRKKYLKYPKTPQKHLKTPQKTPNSSPLYPVFLPEKAPPAPPQTRKTPFFSRKIRQKCRFRRRALKFPP